MGKNRETSGQPSGEKAQQSELFSQFLEKLRQDGVKASSGEINVFIQKLQQVQEETTRREAEKEQKRQREDARIRAVTSMVLPPDWENPFLTDARAQNIHADSISDALVLSLTNMGQVNFEYMSAITGESCQDVIGVLKGAIYQDPERWGECFYQGWETAEEYLSGNLIRKWKIARDANEKYKGYFSDNLRAIKQCLPPMVDGEDIPMTIIACWHCSNHMKILQKMAEGQKRKPYGSSTSYHGLALNMTANAGSTTRNMSSQKKL